MLNWYPTIDAAAGRVDRLKAAGIWPGIIALPDGGYKLTFDPNLGEQVRRYG